MERLNFRLWAVAVLSLVIGGVLFAAPRPNQTKQTEEWIGSKLPTQVNSFKFVPNQEDPNNKLCTYKMDQTTYDVLHPWGIVARVFIDGPEAYDVVVIGSNDKESFHDPKVCFAAQGWSLGAERTEQVATKTRGNVPVTVVDMTKGSEKTIAVYFYRTKKGFIASNTDVKWAMLSYKISHWGANDEGAFIRVIPRHNNADLGKLKGFIGDWLDEAGKTSEGYY